MEGGNGEGTLLVVESGPFVAIERDAKNDFGRRDEFLIAGNGGGDVIFIFFLAKEGGNGAGG